MALYGPFQFANPSGVPVNGVQPLYAGYFCITDPATYAANSTILAQYHDTADHLGTVLAGDSADAPQVTVGLHFPDLMTAQTVLATVNGPAPIQPPNLPSEIPLLRVKVVMAETASAHGGMLIDRVTAFIATLPSNQQVVANLEWAGAPNLVVASSFAQGFKAWEGLSDADWNQLLADAVNLPL